MLQIPSDADEAGTPALYCALARVFCYTKLVFCFLVVLRFFCFAPHNIEVKQENHGTSQPSAKKVGTANGRVMISSSWLQLEEQLNFLIGPEWTFPAD